jgi:L,D-transpeptidase YcbB
MSGVRLDRFLASTAVALLLSTSGGAFADPLTEPATAPVTTPDAANGTAAVTPNQPSETPAPTADQPATPAPAAAVAPAANPDTPAPAASAMPATTANPAKSNSEPETPTPAAVATPPATPAATGTADVPATANPAATTATPAASDLSAADAAIAEQLKQLAGGKFDRIVGSKAERTTIDAFYSGRNYAPIWLTDGQINARAKATIEYLAHVDADGLDPADYPVPNFSALSDPAALAEAELRLTMTVITYAHHASLGRVHWSRVSADILYETKAPEAADVLAAMVEANDAALVLDAYEPHAAPYLALKAKLAQIRAGRGDDTKPPIASGPVLKVGMQDDRVPQLRERLGLPAADDTTYDKALAEAVKKFQQSHDIKATGTLTAATLETINGRGRRPDHAVDIVIANMERWRWMPHDLGDTYVIVNLPDYTLRVMHQGKLLWITRIVVGKPGMPTPIMAAQMKFITINPTWNVPPSIVAHEYLPALQQDPTVLGRMGLKVDYNHDGTVHIWQPPGEHNALGRIRFNFPNKFLVYQHDTPDKYLFAYDKRDYSHGCMRVQDPQRYAEVLLSLVRPNDGYTIARIQKMIAEGSEQDIQFPNFVPVYLTYQTAFVDDDGRLQFREDIYGRDKALVALMTGSERRVADIPIERRENATRRAALAIPDQPSFWGGGGRRYYPGQSDGGGFFSQLFGGFATPEPLPRRPVGHHRRETRARTTSVR